MAATVATVTTAGGDKTSYETLQAAIDYAETKDGSVVDLLADKTGEDDLYIDAGNFTINLNGYDVTGSEYYCFGVSGSSTNVVINGEGSTLQPKLELFDGATVTVNGGTYAGDNAEFGSSVQYTDSFLTINGGTFKKNLYEYRNDGYTGVTTTINGGTFDNSLLLRGSAVIKGATFNNLDFPTITFKNGLDMSQQDHATFDVLDENHSSAFVLSSEQASPDTSRLKLPDGYGIRPHGNQNFAANTLGTHTYYNVEKIYTVTFDHNNGTGDVTTLHVLRTWGVLEQLPDAPSYAGHTFNGWYTAKTGGEQLSTSGYTSDTAGYAQWTVNPSVNYTVQHSFQNVDGSGYTVDDSYTATETAPYGTQTNAVAQNVQGFTAQSVAQQTIAQDGSTVVTILYDRNSYTLAFDANGGQWADGTTALKESTVRYGASIAAPAVSKANYNLTGWSPALPATMPASSVTYTAQWEPTTAQYTVQHAFQNVDLTDYVVDASRNQTLTGTTGAQTAAQALTVEGFTAQTVTQTAIAGNGNTVVTINYDRNTHTLTFDANGGKWSDGTTALKETTVAYGAAITAPVATRSGYTLSWDPAVAATMPNSDVTYTAQ